MSHLEPLVTTQTVHTAGVWLFAKEEQVWVPLDLLHNLNQAREENYWEHVPYQSQEDALVGCGFATLQQEGGQSVQGTLALAEFLEGLLGDLDENGLVAYNPDVHGPFLATDPKVSGFLAWAEEEKGMQRCTACNTPPWVFSRSRQDGQTHVEYDNALVLKFSGGYGMFIDPIGRDRPQAILCHDCAHKLCKQNPWMESLLEPESSHSHLQEYLDSNPEHVGWDTKRATVEDEKLG